MEPMILTDAALEAILIALTDTAGYFDPATAFVGVGTEFTNNGSATVLANITQATGAMATRQPVGTWSTPSKMADGRWVTDGEMLTFRPASAAEGQTIVVAFIATLITAGALRAVLPLTTPVNLANEDKSWTLIPRITVDPEGRWSASIQFNG